MRAVTGARNLSAIRSAKEKICTCLLTPRRRNGNAASYVYSVIEEATGGARHAIADGVYGRNRVDRLRRGKKIPIEQAAEMVRQANLILYSMGRCCLRVAMTGLLFLESVYVADDDVK
jgi:hypothetical protein